MIPLIGMVGLAVDLGYMEFLKKSAQTAADTAALAAAARYHSDTGGTPGCSVNGSGRTGNVGPTPCVSSWQCPNTLTTSTSPANAVEAACVYARANGFWPWKADGAANNQNVLIDANVTSSSSPPPSAVGAKSAAYYVTVRISQQVRQGFSAILGNANGMVSARATAAIVPGRGDCIYVLDATASNAYSQNGSTSLTANCGIYINSNSANAMTNTGSSTLRASDYNIAGNYSWHGTISPTPYTGVLPLPTRWHPCLRHRPVRPLADATPPIAQPCPAPM